MSEDTTAQINNSDKLVILDFYADWCGPCRMLSPTLDKISKEYPDTVEVIKVNVEQDSALASSYGVRSIPHVFFLRQGETVDSFMGAQSFDMISKKIDNLTEKEE